MEDVKKELVEKCGHKIFDLQNVPASRPCVI